MSDHPEPHEDPFAGMPEELRRMMEQLGGSGLFAQIQSMLTGAGSGPVNWDLARQAAIQVAAEGDRAATDEERERATEALRIAEHWLDDSSLPAPPDGGRLLVGSRQEWANAAIDGMRPLVEPVARASTKAMGDLAQDQLQDEDMTRQLDAMGLGGLLGGLGGMDLSSMLQPMGAMLTGMQAGQVIGQLARQLLGQYELGLPTAGRATAVTIPVNVEEAFGDWDLDPMEVALALALHEAAHRRLYHAVPWLEAHLHGLIAQFANGTQVDAEKLQELSRGMMGIDPSDPQAMQDALQRAGDFRIEPTPEQRRVLERIQGVLALVSAWARSAVARVAAGRLPGLDRIDEVLRRRRATKGSGEELLAQLLGLDLRPEDETIGERFVAAVEEAHGPEGLQRALAHPENLPDRDELVDPDSWLQRMAAGEDVPDDASSLFDGLGDAPVERSADERRAEREDDDEA
ncbi:MAG: zinc-dependent metalloprotease [Actinobacteria bacterium]|nr:zinc-dependent metalloprotease [Actinomycetota bacterium]